MSPLRLVILIGILLVVSDKSFGQKQISSGNQQWLQYYNASKIGDHWSIQSDVGIRFRNDLGELSQFLIRSGLGYHLSSDLRVTAGFAFLTFHRNGEKAKSEYRPYQEISLAHTYGKVKTQHRFRSEERFFSEIDEAGIQSNFNYRFRYRFLMSVPIMDLKQSIKILAIMGDEVLINAGREIIYNVFDSNRLLVGPAIQWGPHLNISVLYNYLFAQKNQPLAFSQTHIIWIGIKHKLEFAD